MFCTKCGNELHEGDRFCNKCGEKVREDMNQDVNEQAGENTQSEYQEVVFSPPFKIEAERRTAEISRELEGVTEQPQVIRRQTAAFEWNLDGFPKAEPRKTEDVDFHWEAVVEKRQRDRMGDNNLFVQKEEEAVQPEEDQMTKAPESSDLSDQTEYIDEGVSHSEPPVVDKIQIRDIETQAEAPVAKEIPEKPVETAEDLESQLFGTAYRPLEEYSEEEKSKNTAKLEKFYTYNEKKEAFQQLLDKEYERLKVMEEDRKPDSESLKYTWAAKLYPEEEKKEATIDVSALQKAEEAPVLDMESVTTSEPDQEPDPADMEVETELEETRALKDDEESGDELPVDMSTPSSGESDEIGSETREETADDELGADHESESHEEKARLRFSDVFPREGMDCSGDGGSDGGETSSVQPDEPHQEETSEGVKASQTVEENSDDDDDDEELGRKGAHILLKVIIGILLVLIVIEAVIIGVKFIAPDSAFSIKTNEFVESIIDKLTGGDGGQSDDNLTDDGDGLPTDSTGLSSIIEEKKDTVTTIGQVVEAPSLKYDLTKTYAFKAVSKSADFVDSQWQGGSDAAPATYAEGMVEALLEYYDWWKTRNEDANLIGINKLEIGEIRTGKKGYYILCRLTYAGADGQDVVKTESAYAKITSDSMVIYETREETT
ncbi:MAG: zinc-ribbon domain-containing protein [Firmicutes bacterium]|nr:zinc-ribbon domain-containing protein [Bacillota bacterium]